MAWCENDSTAPMSDLDVMRQALEDAGVTYTLDVHDDAQHGFAPRGPRYDHKASELHWERVHSLLRHNLCAARYVAVGAARRGDGRLLVLLGHRQEAGEGDPGGGQTRPGGVRS